MAAVIFDNANAKFMYYWLTSQYKNIRGMASDDGRDGLNLEIIGSIPCPVPSHFEQQKIVEFLEHKTSQIDALIEKKRALIKILPAETISNNRLDFDKKRGYTSQEDHETYSKKFKPQKGDVFMVKSGATTGKARAETDEEFNIWSPLAALRPNQGMISTDFLTPIRQKTSLRRRARHQDRHG